MPTENKNASRKTKNRNRKVRYEARKSVEDKLTKQYGNTPSSRKRAKAFMKGKDVHKTRRGLSLLKASEHRSKHGRGHKGRPRAYRRK